MDQDIRWIQWFNNFTKSYSLLKKAMEIEQPSEVDKAGIIQFFAVSFELSWKVLKDFLVENGFEVQSPRDTIKTAFNTGYIHNVHNWLDCLADRNLTTHTYDEQRVNEIEQKIRNTYLSLLTEFYNQFLQKKQDLLTISE